jgi:hypothetical protein
MASELKKYQRVQIARERGTRENAFVLEIFDNGTVLVEIPETILVVDREDISDE